MQQNSYTPNLAVFKIWKEKPLAPLTSLTTFDDDPRMGAVAILIFSVTMTVKMVPKEVRLSKIDENEPDSSRTFNWCMMEFPKEIESELPEMMDGGVDDEFPFKAELLKRSENPVLPFSLNPEDWIIK